MKSNINVKTLSVSFLIAASAFGLVLFTYSPIASYAQQQQSNNAQSCSAYGPTAKLVRGECVIAGGPSENCAPGFSFGGVNGQGMCIGDEALAIITGTTPEACEAAASEFGEDAVGFFSNLGEDGCAILQTAEPLPGGQIVAGKPGITRGE